MNKSIYVNNNNLKTVIFPYLIQHEGYKIELVSSIHKGKIDYLNAQKDADYEIDEYVFYEYEQHPYKTKRFNFNSLSKTKIKFLYNN